MSNPLSLHFVGGADEIGGSCLVLEAAGERLLFDFGSRLEEGAAPGFPNFQKEPVPGQTLFLTHGHLDHTGGLPLYRELFPESRICGSPVTGSLIAARGDSRGIVTLHEWSPVAAGGFRITPFPVPHSVPGAFGYLIEHSGRRIVLSGDFNTEKCSERSRRLWKRVRETAGEGIDLFLCDGTGLLRREPGPTEAEVGEELRRIFRTESGDIYATCFSSNWSRIASLYEAAQLTDRKVYCSGTSMESSLRIASSSGYGILAGASIPGFSGQQGAKLVIASGSQGESVGAFFKMSGEDSPVTAEDAVIYSAFPVPGNGPFVKQLLDRFSRLTERMYTPPLDPVHAGGHPSRMEVAFVLDILQPGRWFPIHTAPHYAATAARGDLPGEVPSRLQRGTVLRVDNGVSLIQPGQPSSRFITAPSQMERERLHDAGFMHFTLLRNGRIIGAGSVVTRGFIRRRDASEFLNELIIQLEGCAEEAVSEGILGSSALGSRLEEEMARYIFRLTGKNPEVIVSLIECPGLRE